MHITRLLPVALAFAALSALAQTNEQTTQAPLPFDEADTDGNGILSIEEANNALPEHTITDANGDGWLNHAEVDSTISQASLTIEDSGEHAVVGKSDYERILLTVEAEKRAAANDS